MILFIGDTPSSCNKDPKVAFKGAKCEKRLTSWIEYLGISEEAHLLVNQVDYSYAWFVMFKAKGHILIALGNNASKALPHLKHFKLPHPSGRNRQLNDPKFIESKLKECKLWISNQW